MTLPAPYVASVLLITYRAADTVIAALDSALAQTVPCEIIVSDDASPDATYALIEQRLAGYCGPHRIVVRRSTSNRGIGQHLSDLMALAQGDIFVFMAGDDISHPDRVRLTVDAFNAHPDVKVIGSAVDEIDSDGTLLRSSVSTMPGEFGLEYFARAGKLVTLIGAAMAIRREVFDRFGAVVAGVEDNILTLRATLLGRGMSLGEPLIRYRQHPDSYSNWIFARGDESPERFRRRYERTSRMYREIADNLESALQQLPELPPQRRDVACSIIEMYRIEAEAREAILDKPRRDWLAPIWRGIRHPGLRRKSIERALKLLIPRRWFGRLR